MSIQTVQPREQVDPHQPDTVERGLHTWQLRRVDFEDGVTTRCFECVTCGAARFE